MDFSLSLSVFFSLLTGAILSIMISKWVKVKIEYIMSLCAGVLCGVLLLELIPHSFSDYKAITVFLGIGVGLPIMLIIDKHMHNHSHRLVIDKTASFFFLILAISLHNVPTGLVLGSHGDHDGHLFHLVVFHHIPEGMTLMMIYLASSLKIQHLLASFGFLSVSLNGLASLGGMFPINNGSFLGVLLGLAISTFGYIAIFELFLPSLKIGYKSFHWLSVLTGIFIAGIILIIGYD